MTAKAFRIVAAVELDESARPTWLAAKNMLTNPIAEVSLIHVIPSSDVRHDAAAASSMIEQAHGRMQEFVSRELGDESNPLRERLDIHVSIGDSATQIIQLAVDLEADLIIVGSREKKALERLMLGSVSTEVFRRAPCSVLVARSTDYAGTEKSAAVDPPLAPGQSPRPPVHLVRYRSRPFSTYDASLFPTGIPRKQVR